MPARGEIRSERSRDAQGLRAGFVTQLLGTVLDGVVILVLDFSLLVVFGLVRFLATDTDFEMPQPGPAGNAVVFVIVGVLLLWSSWSGSGRAPGMAVMGIRVVGRDGRELSSRRAFWRAVLAVLTLGWGVVFVAFSKRNKSLYDLMCGSAVVYAWRPGLPDSRQNQ